MKIGQITFGGVALGELAKRLRELIEANAVTLARAELKRWDAEYEAELKAMGYTDETLKERKQRLYVQAGWT